MSEQSFPIGWSTRVAANCFDQVSTNRIKVKAQDYQKSGLYPVIDQGQEFISGYIDDSEKVMVMRPISRTCIFR